MSDNEEILAQFKKWGPAQTRMMIAAGRISTEHQRIALSWLAEVEVAESLQRSEERRTARSANLAAWIAATAAIIAAIAAIVTLISTK